MQNAEMQECRNPGTGQCGTAEMQNAEMQKGRKAGHALGVDSD
jgi:hypothetical protein